MAAAPPYLVVEYPFTTEHAEAVSSSHAAVRRKETGSAPPVLECVFEDDEDDVSQKGSRNLPFLYSFSSAITKASSTVSKRVGLCVLGCVWLCCLVGGEKRLHKVQCCKLGYDEHQKHEHLYIFMLGFQAFGRHGSGMLIRPRPPPAIEHPVSREATFNEMRHPRCQQPASGTLGNT